VKSLVTAVNQGSSGGSILTTYAANEETFAHGTPVLKENKWI
jgi:hypothetical protein